MSVYDSVSQEICGSVKLSPLVKEVWENLTIAQRTVLELRFSGMTLEQVGKTFGEGIQREAVRQHQEAGIKKIKKLLEAKYNTKKNVV